MFLDQLATALRAKLEHDRPVSATATQHGAELLRRGFSIAHVVYDHGDACQSITEMAIEQHAAIGTAEFQALNLCLDDAIAGAVTEYARLRELDIVAADARRATEDLGYLSHELRNLIATASLAFEALKGVGVGIAGSTGAVLERGLMRLHELVGRSLSAVRLKAGIGSPERKAIGGALRVRDLPRKGCVFEVELPRVRWPDATDEGD